MKLISRLAVIAIGMMVIWSCETDDVVAPPGTGPAVSMSLSPSIISENKGQATLTFNLSESSSAPVTISIELSGTAELDSDFSIDGQSVEIPAGALSGQIGITAIDNDEEDGDKIIVITVSSVSGGYTENEQQQSLTIEDDEGKQKANVIFNEVLYDPPPGIDGDANGDGTRDPQEDQFLEFYNNSSLDLDMSGWEVFDATALSNDEPRHVFPEGSILPGGKVHVLFAGGTPTGEFGGSIVTITTSGQLNMNNAGDFMTVKDANGEVILEFDIEPLDDNPNQSYTRSPDITGEFVMHSTIDGITALFSPGTKLDGSPF